MFKASTRSSSCVRYIYGDPITGLCEVTFQNGSSYRYRNVSRRALLNLLFNRNISLGFWVNANILGAYNVVIDAVIPEAYALA